MRERERGGQIGKTEAVKYDLYLRKDSQLSSAGASRWPLNTAVDTRKGKQRALWVRVS